MSVESNQRPEFDPEISAIAHYAAEASIESQEAYRTAHACLFDAMGCAMLALRYPACRKLLGTHVMGSTHPEGACVPGTQHRLDFETAAFNFGTMIRWLDYNDTWLAAEWGHPSDNLGGILMLADGLSRQRRARGQSPIMMRDVLTALIKAYEIQGVIALENSFNRMGLDHVVLVKVASTAVLTQMLGGDVDTIANAVSLAWVDGQSLRTYRHAPNAGSRKSWAAGDATARALRLARMAMAGEMGYPGALSAPRWGFYAVHCNNKAFSWQRDYASYVMENILFKVSYPAEFHSQTALEAAVQLFPQVKDRWENIKTVSIHTHESAVRIISKSGPLHNPADRDHCLQYIVAIGLLFGDLQADHYSDEVAADPRIDALREKMIVVEEPTFTKDYLDPDKRSIANTVCIEFEDGTKTEEVTIEYPLGHRRRRDEAWPCLREKCEANIAAQLPTNRVAKMLNLWDDPQRVAAMPVDEFVDLWII